MQWAGSDIVAILHNYGICYKGDFITLTGYYSTLLHELTHWTGLFSMLKRNIYGGKYNTAYVD